MARLLRAIYDAIVSYRGGVVATPRKRVESRTPNGAIVVKGVAPKQGTKLTAKRISQHLRSLNRSWNAKKK